MGTQRGKQNVETDLFAVKVFTKPSELELQFA